MTQMYDQLAPYYRTITSQKATYINSVDQIILDQIKLNMNTMLDVGSGDGIRAKNLADQAGIKRLVLSEPSKKMVELCRVNYSGEIWNTTAEELPSTGEKFDVLTCLWNVLGHIPNTSSRIASLIKMRCFMHPGSLLFLDVNNRYNASAYGKLEIYKRMVYDILHPNNTRGDSEYEVSIDGNTIKGMGHLFTPQEMLLLIKNSGLKLKQRIMVDYKDGSIHASIIEGQLLYIIEMGES